MASATTPPADPTDVVARRAAAFLIDAALLGMIGLVVFAALRYGAYTGAPANACSVLTKNASSAICLKVGSRVFLWHAGAAKLTVLVVLFFGFLNGVVLQSITGSTVGKICIRLSVVDSEGHKPDPIRMLGRWAFLLVDVGFFFVGGFLALLTHPHRRIGDYVCGTYVVAMRSVGRPIVMEVATDGVGVPANWTAPPAPAPVTAKAGVVAGAATTSLRTPPGTAPTAPGEWGAVARPAPVVRTPQWEAPPEREANTPSVVIESAASPKWAAPPVAPESEKDENADASEKDAKKADAKPGKAKKGADEKGADEKAKDETDEEPDETEAPADADEEVVEATAEPDEEADAEVAEAADEPADDDEAVLVDEAEPEAEAKAETPEQEAGAVDAEPEPEPDTEPELSEWRPVAKTRRGRSAKKSTSSSAKDASWWDAALSSGDAETEVDVED